MNRRQRGFSLIELMVSMTIGIVLIGGAVYVFDEARATLNVNDTVARMQENARWVFDVIEPDVRLAGYWGRHTSGVAVIGRATSANPLAVTVTGDCDTGWAIDVETSLWASNNEDPQWDCVASGDYLAGSDALEVRHAGARVVETAGLEAGRLYVRTHESGLGSLFEGVDEPAIVDGQNNPLVAHAYYVRPYTYAADDNRPSLRRRGLTVNGGAPAVVDQEVISGVEDFQVQFGIDADDNGSVDRYVNPDNAALNADPRILAVRVWLRLRADLPEPGFSDTRNYRYADRDYTPADEETGFRRLLVSRTIFLRNESIMEGGG